MVQWTAVCPESLKDRRKLAFAIHFSVPSMQQGMKGHHDAGTWKSGVRPAMVVTTGVPTSVPFITSSRQTMPQPAQEDTVFLDLTGSLFPFSSSCWVGGKPHLKDFLKHMGLDKFCLCQPNLARFTQPRAV